MFEKKPRIITTDLIMDSINVPTKKPKKIDQTKDAEIEMSIDREVEHSYIDPEDIIWL